MKQITTNAFENEVLKSPVPVLLDFYTEGCAPCRRLKPILDEVEQEQAGKLKLVQVDAYAEAELAAHHRVSSVPALFVYRQGQCVDQRLGLASKR